MVDSQRGAQRRVSNNDLISNKREWNNCFIKKNISRIFPTLFVKTTDFQLVSLACFSGDAQKMKGFLFYSSVGSKSAFLAETVETGDKYLGMSKARQGRLMRKM